MDKKKRDAEWAEAKSRCRLNDDDIRKAKELGMGPRSLTKNIPSKSEPWKWPVHEWIRDLYEKRFPGATKTSSRLAGEAPRLMVDAPAGLDAPELAPFDDIPFNADDPEDDLEEDDEFEGVFDDSDDPPTRDAIAEQDRDMLQLQRRFRRAAEVVADGLSGIPVVSRVVLFGSVAQPLKREVPRFREFRRHGLAVLHECMDVDLAVWVADTGVLRQLQRARSRALNDLLARENIGVAHHQVEIFLMQAATDTYLGRLCTFGKCPKGKPACRVAGCGAPVFLQQLEDFELHPAALDPARSVLLFDRAHPFRA